MYNESLYTGMTNKATEMSFIQRRWKFLKISDLHVTSVQTSFSKQVFHILISLFLSSLFLGSMMIREPARAKNFHISSSSSITINYPIIFFSPVFQQGPFSVNSTYALLLPALKEVWLAEQCWNPKWAWIQVFTVLSPWSLIPGEQGISLNVYRYHSSSKQDSLANGIDIPAEMNAIHNDEQKLKTSNTN